jgi:hypothetical protein
MKIIFISLSVLAVILFSGCRERELTVVSSEAWHDLMPGAGGKTHLNIVLRSEDVSPDQVMITGLIVNWDSGTYKLQKSEWETVTSDSTINIKAGFSLKNHEAEVISVEISGIISEGYELKKHISDIKIDKVY